MNSALLSSHSNDVFSFCLLEISKSSKSLKCSIQIRDRISSCMSLFLQLQLLCVIYANSNFYCTCRENLAVTPFSSSKGKLRLIKQFREIRYLSALKYYLDFFSTLSCLYYFNLTNDEGGWMFLFYLQSRRYSTSWRAVKFIDESNQMGAI
jgi:hypothetical protein